MLVSEKCQVELDNRVLDWIILLRQHLLPHCQHIGLQFSVELDNMVSTSWISHRVLDWIILLRQHLLPQSTVHDDRQGVLRSPGSIAIAKEFYDRQGVLRSPKSYSIAKEFYDRQGVL